METTLGWRNQEGRLMAILSKSELRALIEQPHSPCVSLFMPTHRMGAEVQQDPTRLKNLLREAEQQLLARGLRRPEAEALLDPAHRLVPQLDFWQHQSDGLAVFLAPDVFRTYRLPFEVEELVVVADRFHIKPLLPLFSADGQFYVLALSQNDIRLLQGTRFSVHEMELKDVPTSLAEALRYDDFEKQLQYHTATQSPGGRGGERPAVYFGQGAESDEAKTNLLRYFQQVDEGVCQTLGDARAPLVLAGVEYLHPLYREASHYANVMAEGIPGNPEDLSAEELHARAWTIVEPVFQAAQRVAVDRYHQLAGSRSPQASADLATIVPAAYYGRVETLFVARDQQRWGVFDPESNQVVVHPSPEEGDEDLLDFTAAHTVLNGGMVYAVESDQVPDHAPAAAIFRY
jgi:hypothetical protein